MSLKDDEIHLWLNMVCPVELNFIIERKSRKLVQHILALINLLSRVPPKVEVHL